MSTSPKRATAPADTKEAAVVFRLEPFPYKLVDESGTAQNGDKTTRLPPDAEKQERAQESATQEAQFRTEGYRKGQAEAQQRFEDKLAKERSSIAAALAQFTRDRAEYFEKVEGQVVQLALSIARKILHREAQLDPLLLAGIVRVALEKVDADTGVVLRLHPQQSADWRSFLATRLEPADRPEIVEDASQDVDTCVLETAMGTAVFGVDVQLKEIEHGLMDLLAARPGAPS
jgi:flagellar assembly protein FliH